MPETIYETITRDILTKMDKGIYKAGTRLPSVSELCAVFQCSKAPARFALESLRKQGRIWSRRGAGYFVLEGSRPEERLTFGLIQGPRHYIPAYMELGLRLSEQLLEQGHSLIQCGGLLAPCDEDRDENRFPEVKRLISCGLSGVFIVPFNTSKLSTLANSRLTSLLHVAELPVVLLDSKPEPQEFARSCDSVSVDHHAAGELAADHLFARKGFPFNCVERGVRHRANLDRLDGVHRVIRRQGKDVPAGMLRLGDPLEDLSSPRFVDSLLRMESGEKARGLICLDSGAAQMFAVALTARDAKIPRDLLLVGFDDTSNVTHYPHPITLVRPPLDDIARVAIRTMFERRNPQSLPYRRILLPPRLCPGRSTKEPFPRP